MADPSDIFRQMLASQQQAGGGAGAPPILLGLKDVDAGAALSIKGKGLNSDWTFRPVAQAAPGPIAKLIQSMGLDRKSILEGMQKVAQAAPVQQADSGSVYGRADHGHGLGGFSASSASSYEIS